MYFKHKSHSNYPNFSNIWDVICYYKYKFILLWNEASVVHYNNTPYVVPTILCYIVLILFCYYALLWHVLYLLVNVDQDEIKVVLVNVISGKNKSALR